MVAAAPTASLSPTAQAIARHWEELAQTRRLYNIIIIAALLFVLAGSLWFANDSNAGKFFDRLPHVFDFVGQLAPREAAEVWRAMFDLPSPFADGSLKYNYEEERVYVTENFYIPEYFYKMAETLNIALVSIVFGCLFGFVLCFLASKNMMPNPWIRGFVRRILEILRAFPEIVIAGFLLAIFSLGAIPAIIAVTIHTIGALGKMFYEVVENADMRAEEGLRAVGGNWLERVWFGIVPQIMPNFLSYALLRLEINVRASTIIGAVGAGGIGEPLRLSIGQAHEAKTLAIIVILFSTIVLIDQISAALRRSLVGDQAFEFGR